MRSSGGEAARGPRVRSGRGEPRMIARSPGVRLGRVPARGRVDHPPCETSIRTAATMADARQRDAESTWPVRAPASAATGGCARWPRESRPRARRATRASPATGEAGAVSGTGSILYKKERTAPRPMPERRRGPRGRRPMPGRTSQRVSPVAVHAPPGSR